MVEIGEPEFTGAVRINWHRVQWPLSGCLSSRVLDMNNRASFRLIDRSVIDRSARSQCSSNDPSRAMFETCSRSMEPARCIYAMVMTYRG